VLSVNLFEQVDRGFGIDSVIKTRDHLKASNINSTVDIQPLSITVGFNLCLLALFDPAIRRHTVMLVTARTGQAIGLNGQGVVNSVVAELNKVLDFEASVDVDSSDIPDMSGSWIAWKGNKTRISPGCPYQGEWRTDGSVWNVVNTHGREIAINDNRILEYVKSRWGLGYLQPIDVLSERGDSWQLDESDTFMVNSVECWRIFSENIEVWVDTEKVNRVIRLTEGP
jgi:hypothetical protein